MKDGFWQEAKGREEIEALALPYFLELIALESTSDEEVSTCPSTEGQLRVAELGAKRLKENGVEVTIDANGYVMGRLPANEAGLMRLRGDLVRAESVDKCGAASQGLKLGLIAHMDTAPDYSGRNIRARKIVFDGDCPLDANGEKRLRVEDFPEMKDLLGEELLVTDGSTLLSADDKAGMAAILALTALLQRHPEWPHGELRLAFTPDEEIGRGAHRFDVEAFDADVAFTIDGGALGELESESFHAASAKVVCRGRSVHPGSAKNVLINAQLLAHDFVSRVLDEGRPETTEGREGFLHLHHAQGDVSEAQLHFIIRDFDRQAFEARKQRLVETAQMMNASLDEPRIGVEIADQYHNMREVIEQHPYLLEAARAAYADAGVPVHEIPIRGGTDGSQLSFKGLPCPNLFTGGGNFHGPFEYLHLAAFYRCVEVLLHLVRQFTDPARIPSRNEQA